MLCLQKDGLAILVGDVWSFDSNDNKAVQFASEVPASVDTAMMAPYILCGVLKRIDLHSPLPWLMLPVKHGQCNKATIATLTANMVRAASAHPGVRLTCIGWDLHSSFSDIDKVLLGPLNPSGLGFV